MTVKELYEWAVENECENAKLQIYQTECLDCPAEYIDITECSTSYGSEVVLYPW